MELRKLGEIIRQRRELLNIRQEDLSELSGVNSRTIHLIEKGGGNPSIKTLAKIADVLGLEIMIDVKKIS